jgi:aminoglycoside 6'-N-acetyltransferase I
MPVPAPLLVPYGALYPMLVDLTIRPISHQDRMEWMRMRLALWPETSAAEHEQEVDAFDPALVLVAERPAGGLAGFLELAVRPHAAGCRGPVPFIEGWYVDPDVRRRGVGRALVAAAEAWARQHGYREMASDTEVERSGSILAHQAVGFEVVERVVLFRKPL